MSFFFEYPCTHRLNIDLPGVIAVVVVAGMRRVVVIEVVSNKNTNGCLTSQMIQLTSHVVLIVRAGIDENQWEAYWLRTTRVHNANSYVGCTTPLTITRIKSSARAFWSTNTSTVHCSIFIARVYKRAAAILPP